MTSTLHRLAQTCALSALCLTAGCERYAPFGDCWLRCHAQELEDGNAQLSSIPEVDSYLDAILDLQTSTGALVASFRLHRAALARSLGLSPSATDRQLQLTLESRLGEATSSGLRITTGHVRCTSSAEAVSRFASRCEPTRAGSPVASRCDGTCEGAEACAPGTNRRCVGAATTCAGQCVGVCELEAPAECAGRCRGSCLGTCTVRNGSGDCAGECVGECIGTCEQEAGGTCPGICTGACHWMTESECDAGAELLCDAPSDESSLCEAVCDGRFEAPDLGQPCSAAVEAVVHASTSCTPPSLGLSYQWSEEFLEDESRQPAFRAWLVTFEDHYAPIVAAEAKARNHLLPALQGLRDSYDDYGAALAAYEGEGDLALSIGAGCALASGPQVEPIIEHAQSELGEMLGAQESVALVFE